MPGYERNDLEFQRRDGRRETAAGSAVQNKKVLKFNRRDAVSFLMPLAMPDKSKVLKNTPTRRRQLLLCRLWLLQGSSCKSNKKLF
jgi:hypothetical protein